MKTERNLFRELDIVESTDYDNVLEIDTQKIKHMVHNSIDSAHPERKLTVMKARLKYSLAAAIAILALATTALATNGIIVQWNGSSLSTPEFLSLPTQEEVSKYIDYDAVLLDNFENGYKFENGSIVYNEMVNEENRAVETFRSLKLRYGKDGDTVLFSQLKCNAELGTGDRLLANIDDINIYYNRYTNKLVPADYEMTDADKLAEASGALVFSWGTEAVEIVQVQSVSWIENDIHYQLLQIDGTLTASDLVSMAEEIIKSQT